MDTQLLRIFHRVALRRSFAQVAREEGVDPSQVSRQIATLEERLGFQLFQRSTRKVSLTAAGAIYLEQTVDVLDALSQARECALKQQTQPQGLLTVTASTAFGQTCLLPLLPDFLELYPSIELDLRLTDAVVDIVTEQIDLACRLSPTADPNLVAYKLFDAEFWLCASPAYLAAHDEIEEPCELQGHVQLAINLPGYRDRWLFHHATLTDYKLSLSPRVVASNALALKELVARGVGVGLVASWMVSREIECGELVRLLPDYRVSAIDLPSAAWLVYPERRYQPAKTQALVKFLKERLG